jgi:uncharacterized protein YdhG (YjbR/CyaY superfamily)
VTAADFVSLGEKDFLRCDEQFGRTEVMPAKARTIDDYLARVGETQRAALEKLRRDIQAAVPSAEECISYDMPGFRLGPRVLVTFGAAKNHCAFYPGAQPIRAHENELAAYALAKGTIRFPADKPLPAQLVKKLMKTRIDQFGA